MRKQRKKAEVKGVRSTKIVTVQVDKNGEKEFRDYEVETFETDPANVGINVHQTINTGDYSSLRVGVSINYPCYKELIEPAFEKIADLAAELLEAEVDKYLGGEKDA